MIAGSSAAVSAHYGVRSSDGDLTQMVDEADIAWHAGDWDTNARSIGILSINTLGPAKLRTGASAAWRRGQPVHRAGGSPPLPVPTSAAQRPAAGRPLAARRAGLSDAMLFDILSRSTGDSRVLRARYPGPGVDDAHPANRDYEALFTLDLMTKDMELAETFVADAGLDPALLEAATAVYHEAQAEQLGGLDYSGLIRLARLQEEAR